MKLCFATNNPNKLAEIKKAVGNIHEIVDLKSIACYDELPENQDTLEGNSKEKADYIYNNYHVACFADDTGLEVEALNGEPGVYSARYAGPKCDARDNMKLLLQKMAGIKNRKAKFRTVITLIRQGETFQFEGAVNGTIRTELSGAEGFGYDPIFEPEGYNVTFAEMTMEDKNAISHRGLAVQKLVDFLLN